MPDFKDLPAWGASPAEAMLREHEGEWVPATGRLFTKREHAKAWAASLRHRDPRIHTAIRRVSDDGMRVWAFLGDPSGKQPPAILYGEPKKPKVPKPRTLTPLARSIISDYAKTHGIGRHEATSRLIESTIKERAL